MILFLLLVRCLTFSFAQNGDGKTAEKHTKLQNAAWKDYLDFKDTTDFENARKGLIAQYPLPVIGEAYSFEEFDFIKGQAPETVNPSLWRQSELNAISGLFKVTEGVYQVRGFDLANMTFVKGKTGWIVIGPLTVRNDGILGVIN